MAFSWYGLSMEDRFFYPDDSVVPVEIGDGYKDYMLNDILAVHDCVLLYGKIRDNSVAEAVTLAGSIRIQPYVAKQGMHGCLFNDARVRFLSDFPEPFWVSLFYDDIALPIDAGKGYSDYKLSQLLPKSSNVKISGSVYVRDEEYGESIIPEITINKSDGIRWVCRGVLVCFLPVLDTSDAVICFSDALIRQYDNQSCSLVGLYFKNTYHSIVDTPLPSLPKPLLLELNLQESSEKKSHWGTIKCGWSLSEDNYLFPGDEITPIEVGDGYRDYRLSEVLQQQGYQIGEGGCEIHFARNGLYEDLSIGYLFALVHLSNGDCVVLAPINYHHLWSMRSDGSLFRLDKPTDEAIELANSLIRYADMRIRYYLQGDNAKRPVWVSAYGVGRRFFQKDADGKDMLVYPEIELASGYEQIPFCTELIEGPLIEHNLVQYHDIVDRLLKSPFIDYAE